MQSNVFTVLGKEKTSSNEVIRMRSADAEGRCYICVQISGYKELDVFELKPVDKTIRLFGKVKLEHQFVDFRWFGKALYLYCPENGSLHKYKISSHGGLWKDDTFLLPVLEHTLKDLRGKYLSLINHKLNI